MTVSVPIVERHSLLDSDFIVKPAANIKMAEIYLIKKSKLSARLLLSFF